MVYQQLKYYIFTCALNWEAYSWEPHQQIYTDQSVNKGAEEHEEQLFHLFSERALKVEFVMQLNR